MQPPVARLRKVTVLPQGIDTDRFQPGIKVPGLIACVGRLSPEKNFGAVIGAMDEWPWANLLMIGDGPMYGEWARHARASRVWVWMLGNIDNGAIGNFLRRAEYLIHPALYEQAPKVVLEAMACGCCVLTTDRQFVEDGVTGFLCGTSPESIIAAMARAQGSDREEIGKAARVYVVEHHALARVAWVDAVASMVGQEKSEEEV